MWFAMIGALPSLLCLSATTAAAELAPFRRLLVDVVAKNCAWANANLTKPESESA